MSETVQNIKNIVLKGIEAIGSKASDLASSTRQKMDIMNLESQKKELISTIGEKVMDLSQQGTLFPNEIEDLLNEITGIDEKISSLRNSDIECKNENTEASPEESGPERGTCPEIQAEEPAAVEYAAQDNYDVPVIEVESEENDTSEDASCPLSSSINDLFEKIPPMEKMMDKVNSSLDELGDNLMKFSGEFDKNLNDFADQMMGNDKKDPEK